jgi:hypothetical protein
MIKLYKGNISELPRGRIINYYNEERSNFDRWERPPVTINRVYYRAI